MVWIKRLSFASLFLLFVYLSFTAYSIAKGSTSADQNPSIVGVDYAMYYTAGRLQIESPSANLYNAALHNQKMEQITGRKPPSSSWWIYPPTFLLAIVPLAHLPYSVSLAVWIALTLGFMMLSAFFLLPKSRHIALLICGFPGVLMNLHWGQNAFLSTGLLGFGIAFMETKPVLSGLMFGLLTYKPQLAVFPLLMLLLCKKWKVLSWSLLFAAASALLSGLVFGFDVWLDFIRSALTTSSNIMSSAWSTLSAIQPSFYSVFRLAGIGREWTYGFLIVTAVCTILAVRWVYKNADSIALKGSALVLGMLLILPYYIQYDLMLLALPLILLSYDCFERGHSPWEILCLAALWLMPFLNWPLVVLTDIQICPFVVSLVLVMTLLRVKREIRPAV